MLSGTSGPNNYNKTYAPVKRPGLFYFWLKIGVHNRVSDGVLEAVTMSRYW